MSGRTVIFTWTQTVADLIAEGAEVWAHCSPCRSRWRCDLVKIAKVKGPLYSLWNRTSPCRTPGCAGRVWFKAQCPGSKAWVHFSDADPAVVGRLHEAWRASRDGEMLGEEVRLNPAVEARLQA